MRLKEINGLRKWSKEHRGNGSRRRDSGNGGHELQPDSYVPPTTEELISKLQKLVNGPR